MFDLDPQEFVVVEADGHLSLVYAGEAGVYCGSWNDIFDEKSTGRFVVEVHDRQVDTRTALSYAVYCAFIDGLVARGVDPLPDSHEFAHEHHCQASYTWLTGEQYRFGYAPVGLVVCGAPYRNALSPTDHGVAMFRPSARLA
jgi:hypothetical protein